MPVYDNRIKIKSYPQFDIAKIFMAIFVVAIHTRPFEGISGLKADLCEAIVRLAVPLFFLISGFLLEEKCKTQQNTKEQSNAILKYIIKTVRLYIIWTIIYLPIAVLNFYWQDASLFGAVFTYIRKFVFIGEQFYSYQLWYLLSTIYGLLAILLFRNRVKDVVWFVVSIVVILISQMFEDISISSSAAVMNIQKITTLVVGEGRVLSGFFYLSMGMLISRNSHKEKQWIPGVIALVSFIMGVITKLWIFAVISRICCFVLLKNLNINIKTDIPSKLRKISTDIYFWHMWIFFVLYLLNGKQHAYGIKGFIITAISALLISVLQSKLKIKFKNQNLNKSIKEA
ncbi:MAG: acyltransferase [Clostridia bacterium]|nr:acyltransferase [Clostridia bacterium]